MGSSDEQRTYIGEYSDNETSYSYLNARYYNPGTGMFLSEDPVFLEMGDSVWIERETGGDIMLLLSDPQQANSYSYARDNPIIYRDPAGNLTTRALLFDPIGSLRRAAAWGAASMAAILMGKPFSAALMMHSISLNPQDITINEQNQKQYGGAIDQIRGTSQYQDYIDRTIEKAKNGEMTNSSHFEFEDKADLYYSLHGVNIQSQVTVENGNWIINSTVSDRYDFNATNPKTYKGTITRIPATQAYQDQQDGILSNYNIKINFSDKVKK